MILPARTALGQEWWRPYSPPCTERENVFAFAREPTAKLVGKDRYEIKFAVKGYCDVTVGVIDERGKVVRHLGSGVLGKNAPPPFQKNSLRQTIYWNGKDDLDVYHKEPGKLKVRVMLGLKPVFDKLLGGSSPHNLPGYVAGMAAFPEGIIVFVRGMGQAAHITVRHFDRDGEYVRTVFPPPANLPQEKLGGMTWIEYEPGKKALHGMSLAANHWTRGLWMPPGVDWGALVSWRPVVVGKRIYFSSSGYHPAYANKPQPAILHWIHTDGSTDLRGSQGRIYMFLGGKLRARIQYPHLAASADGKRMFMLSARSVRSHAVYHFRADGTELAEPLFGHPTEPGSGSNSLSSPVDIESDGKGRLYIADRLNNRVQVVSEDGEYLKTIQVATPAALQVHRKTGEVYVLHSGRVRGKAVGRLTKFSAFPALKKLYHQDGLTGPVFALDSWSKRPRAWLARSAGDGVLQGGTERGEFNLRVYEEQAGKFVEAVNFNQRAKTHSGESYHGRWKSNIHADVKCDPVRERVVYHDTFIFDLKAGRYLGRTAWARDGVGPFAFHGDDKNEAAFDKRGYMHIEHAYRYFRRVDPDRKVTVDRRTRYAEVPYDHGEAIDGFKGVVKTNLVGRHPVGIGVNMRGDLAAVLNVERVPRLETQKFFEGTDARLSAIGKTYRGHNRSDFEKALRLQELKGEALWMVPRRPGVSVSGGVVWTWDRSGELRKKGAVLAGHRVNGVQIDEDGDLYFSNARFRMVAGKPFLIGRAGRYGDPKHKETPFTGVFLKGDGNKVEFRSRRSKIEMDPLPNRAPDLATAAVTGGYARGSDVWVEGAKWLYAGASPMKPGDCMCPQLRAHLDWYKRSYVPETYRHSIGVLDTNGNLILHIGQYGNFDSGHGPRSKVPVGGDGIASTFVRYVSGTDDYLVFEDWGERLVVLKLNYHVEETAPVSMPRKEVRE